MPPKQSKVKNARSKVEAARLKIERIIDEANKAINKPRVTQHTKADLNRIVKQANVVLKLLDDPDPKKRRFFEAARDFFIWLVRWLWRSDGT